MKQNLRFYKETVQVFTNPIFRANPRAKPRYREISTWYVDLPQYLEAGIGTKANLMMVAGADTLLDLLSKEGDEVSMQINTVPFEGYDLRAQFLGQGMDPEELASVGHPDVEFGGYYNVVEYEKRPFMHQFWLCPVALYVFEGQYPREIFIKVLSDKTVEQTT